MKLYSNQLNEAKTTWSWNNSGIMGISQKQNRWFLSAHNPQFYKHNRIMLDVDWTQGFAFSALLVMLKGFTGYATLYFGTSVASATKLAKWVVLQKYLINMVLNKFIILPRVNDSNDILTFIIFIALVFIAFCKFMYIWECGSRYEIMYFLFVLMHWGFLCE